MTDLDLTEAIGAGANALLDLGSDADARRRIVVVVAAAAPLIERQVRERIADDIEAAAARYHGPGNDRDDRLYGQGLNYGASVARRGGV